MQNVPGAHALLLGMEGTGRKTLVRLVAHIMQAEVYHIMAHCNLICDVYVLATHVM